MTTAWASTAGAVAASAASQTSSAAAQSGAKPLEGDDGVCGVCSLSPLALGTRTLGASSPARQTRVVAAPASKQYIAILFCGVLAPRALRSRSLPLDRLVCGVLVGPRSRAAPRAVRYLLIG